MDLLQIAISVATIIGLAVAVLNLRNNYLLGKIKALSEYNERLMRSDLAHGWINQPDRGWDQLNDGEKTHFRSYVAVFEDIAVARKAGIIRKKDFLGSFSERYRKFRRSGVLEKYIVSNGYSVFGFSNLEILDKDVSLK